MSNLLHLALQTVQYAILALSYLGLALGSLPGLRMNRATIALAGAGLLVGTGLLTLEAAWQAIDATTIVFLLSMMIVNASLAYAGFFELVLTGLLRLSRSPFGLLVILSLGSGLLSALFLNDTIAIVLTPLTLGLAQSLGLNPVPYLLGLAAATNIGSVATISGNPQNILIGSFSKIAYLDFAWSLTPVALMGLALQIGLLWLFYPEVRSLQPGLNLSRSRSLVYRPLLHKSVTITGLLLVAFMVGFPLANAALIAAALLLITRRIKPARFLGQVEWELLVMFSGLFVLTSCTEKLNLLSWLTDWTSAPWGLVGVTVLLSNLISNVPAVLLLGPIIPATDQQAWLLLAMSSTLAGNLTLFGSVANLIVAEAVLKQGYQLSFWEHLKFGLPLTLLTVAAGYLWLV